YVSYWTTQYKPRFDRIKKQAKAAGFNTLVIDIKTIIEKQIMPFIKNETMDYEIIVHPDPWLSQLVKELHQEGFIVVGRVVVFKDDHLAIARPDLQIKTKNNKYYRDRKGGRWVDPYSPEVRLYNEYIAEIAAKSGIDEIQFDYIRFPAEGAAYNIKSDYQDGRSRVDIINQFLKDVNKRVKSYKVSLAVDIFGVTAWQKRADIETLGQSIEAMAELVDVICPMFYPSHFHSGYDGIKNPGEHPYYFVNTGVKKALQMIGSREAKLSPWIQGFALGTNNFGRNYIQQQINACTNESVTKFLIWNAGNRYDYLPKSD
ncbi:MAG: hypothetical protein HQ564_05515, partial [Candidatus Saganbacteria bacterium]|nr:hypothetical protein [Candidatus Saganbacteria bacterium]